MADGSAFAHVSGLSVLPPNLNVSAGLVSIHSYNSLSSMRYHRLVEALGGEMITYGRLNTTIAPDYASAIFWMSNIQLILSGEALDHANLSLADTVAGINLYQVNAAMGESLQVETDLLLVNDIKKLTLADPRLLVHYPAKKIKDAGDVRTFQVSSKNASILILSQKFHHDWVARVLTSRGWQQASTVEVNGIFQGVKLPQGTERVELQFKPFSRFAWVAHVFWVLLLVLIALQWRLNHAGRMPLYKFWRKYET